jgi:hypothetical protein
VLTKEGNLSGYNLLSIVEDFVESVETKILLWFASIGLLKMKRGVNASKLQTA